MRRLLILPLLLGISSSALAIPALADKKIPDEVHNACKDVADYKGCVELRIGKTSNYLEGIRETKRKDGTTLLFHPDAVVAKKVRGEYGRYLNYRYYRLGQRSEWIADADCEDYTVNWEGDVGGWRDVRVHQKESSKEALKILDEFCPQMDRLVEETKSGQTKNFRYPIMPTGKSAGGFGGAGAAINAANQRNQIDILRFQNMNQMHSLPPQYRGTVRPSF